MTRNPLTFACLFAAVAATGCGANTAAVVLPATQTVGAAGGSVALSDGTRVDVPAGALAADVTLTITPTDAAAVPESAIGPAYTFGPEGQKFATAATVVLPYDAGKLPQGATVVVLTAPAGTMDFEPLEATVVDATHVSAQTLHFSTFVVASSAPTTLQPGESFPTGLTVSGGRLYWVNQGNTSYGAPSGKGHINSIATIGGAPTFVVVQQVDPKATAVVGTTLYFASGGMAPSMAGGATGAALLSVPLPTGAASPVVSSLGFPLALTANATNLYWADYDKQTINTSTLSGASPKTLATAQANVRFIAVSGSFVYWTSTAGGTVNRAPIDGTASAAVLVPSQSSPAGIAVTSQYVYWANSGNGTISRAPLTGGVATVVADGQTKPWALASDGTNVYWTNMAGGTVMRYSGTTTLTQIASNQAVPISIAVDSTRVYWANNGNGVNQGSIVSAPK